MGGRGSMGCGIESSGQGEGQRALGSAKGRGREGRAGRERKGRGGGRDG